MRRDDRVRLEVLRGCREVRFELALARVDDDLRRLDHPVDRHVGAKERVEEAERFQHPAVLVVGVHRDDE
jgi:hypothetical protein